MTTVRMKVDPSVAGRVTLGRVDVARLDATTDQDIEAQAAMDDDAAMQDMAKFTRRVRRRLGLSQMDFSQRIDVPVDTIRNWEQGKRSPAGAAKALLKVLDRMPEAALAALS
jgi:putative transcriptional regulator